MSYKCAQIPKNMSTISCLFQEEIPVDHPFNLGLFMIRLGSFSVKYTRLRDPETILEIAITENYIDNGILEPDIKIVSIVCNSGTGQVMHLKPKLYDYLQQKQELLPKAKLMTLLFSLNPPMESQSVNSRYRFLNCFNLQIC